MTTYFAPVSDMAFALGELAGLREVASLPAFEEATPETVEAILHLVAW